jgi:hypothetical protein
LTLMKMIAIIHLLVKLVLERIRRPMRNSWAISMK